MRHKVLVARRCVEQLHGLEDGNAWIDGLMDSSISLFEAFGEMARDQEYRRALRDELNLYAERIGR